uniref:Protein kinase domain-containing protein n=1 Tax=Acrobeloides nanus TaxID=290746 RepID=A0A914C4Y2_9BILA
MVNSENGVNFPDNIDIIGESELAVDPETSSLSLSLIDDNELRVVLKNMLGFGAFGEVYRGFCYENI